MSIIRYTQDHEWISVDGDVGTIGITKYAQEQLGDIVFVELPEAGAAFAQGEQAAVVESVKAASEVYAPVSGEVTEANAALIEDPALIGGDPEGSAWLYRLRLSAPGELDALMDADAYKTFLEGLA